MHACVALGLLLGAVQGCCWVHQRTCSQETGDGLGLGYPSGVCCLRSEEGVQVCPSAVANCVPVRTEAIGDCMYAIESKMAPQRALSLSETVQIALGNAQTVRNLGLVEARSNPNNVRGSTTVYDRGEAAARADAEWGVFDPVLTSELNWERQDIPPGVSFGGFGTRPQRLDFAEASTGIHQKTLIGGDAFVEMNTDYLFNPARPAGLDPNPQYFSRLDFGYEQPFMRGSGIDVNLSSIRIASAVAGQSVWEFKREMLALVRSVETAAWELEAAEGNLAVIEEVIPRFEELVATKQKQFDRGVAPASDVSRAKSDWLRYKQERLEILSTIAEQQLVLRNLLGLNPCDGTYLQLDLEPRFIGAAESAQQSLQVALRQRPDILSRKLAIYIAGQERIQAKDSLRPEVNGRALYRYSGLDNDLDGSVESVYTGEYDGWEMGVGASIPLGRRQGWGNVRAAELRLLRERAQLDQVSHQAASEVADAHRRLDWLAQQQVVTLDRITELDSWRRAARAKVDNPPQGMSYDLAFEIYVRSLNNYVEATRQAHAIVADYNSAFARLEEVKGTLLDRRMVFVDGDPSEKVRDVIERPLSESVETPQADGAEGTEEEGSDAAGDDVPSGADGEREPNEQLPRPGTETSQLGYPAIAASPAASDLETMAHSDVSTIADGPLHYAGIAGSTPGCRALPTVDCAPVPEVPATHAPDSQAVIHEGPLEYPDIAWSAPGARRLPTVKEAPAPPRSELRMCGVITEASSMTR